MLFNGYIKVKSTSESTIGSGGFPSKGVGVPTYTDKILCRYKVPKLKEEYTSQTLKNASYAILVHANAFEALFTGRPGSIALYSNDDTLLSEKVVLSFQKLNLVAKIEIFI